MLNETTITKVECRQIAFYKLCEMSSKELGLMFSCDGAKLYSAIHMIPMLSVEATIKPITQFFFKKIKYISEFCFDYRKFYLDKILAFIDILIKMLLKMFIFSTIIQIQAQLTPSFVWNDHFLGSTQRFWIFIEDLDENIIMHYEQLMLKKKQV